MPVELTDKALKKSFKPRDKRYEVADSKQPGLRLVVQPSGVMSWVYRYERQTGQAVKMTLGPAAGPGAIGLADARNTANDYRRLRATGVDPASQQRSQRTAEADRIAAGEKEARRKDDTVSNVLPRYYSDHVDALKSGDEVKRVLNRELKGWAKRRLDDIQRKDAIILLDAKKITAPIQAKRLRAHAKHFFDWCKMKELVQTNPFNGTKAVKEIARDRVLTDDELRLLLRAIEQIEWPRKQLVQLLLLTAQRLDEVGAMEWSELDLTSASPAWVIPGARTKNNTAHVVPLSPAAIEILASMNRLADTPRVFASFAEAHAKKRIDKAIQDVAQEEALARGEDPKRIAITPWRFHDLRRTAATTMPRLGVDVTTVERVLNHTLRGVMAVYQRYTFDREKRHALEVWSRFLTSLNTTQPADVFPINADAAVRVE